MALLIEGKKQIVAEVTEVASTAFAAVVADYQGLTVEQLTALRVEARKLGVATRVVRNTLAKRASYVSCTEVELWTVTVKEWSVTTTFFFRKYVYFCIEFSVRLDCTWFSKYLTTLYVFTFSTT